MKCPNCQTSNPDEAKFCMNCGHSLAVNIPASDRGIDHVQGKNNPLEKFIPQELLTKIEAARSVDAMVGERRVITMLFCDVKGSTAAAEKVERAAFPQRVAADPLRDELFAAPFPARRPGQTGCLFYPCLQPSVD